MKPLKKKLTPLQIVCCVLLWAALCYWILTSVERVDGPVIFSIVLSAIYVFIPIYCSIKKEKGDK